MPTYPPPWSGYPPSSPPPLPSFNGHESMLLGSLLGELKSGQAQTIHSLNLQTEVLRQIHGQLAENATLMADRLPAAPATPEPKAETMTWRDWAQIGVGLVVVLGALAGKIPLKDVPGLIGKPLGF